MASARRCDQLTSRRANSRDPADDTEDGLARFGQHHQSGLGHRVGSQAPAVKAVRRVPVKRLSSAASRHCPWPFVYSEIQECQHGFVDPVLIQDAIVAV